MEVLEYNEEQLRKELQSVADRARHLERIMPAIGARFVASMQENFDVGGRYMAVGGGQYEGGSQRWKPSKEPADPKKKRGTTMLRTNATRRGIHFIAGGLTLMIYSAPLEQSAILHYGGNIQHPGGTAYIIMSRRSGKGLSKARGMARFIKNSEVGTYEAKGRTVKRTRPHVIHIDARPYLVVQPADWEYAGGLIMDELSGNTST